MKALNQANGSTPKKDQQIGKAFRLKPLNSPSAPRVPEPRPAQPVANPPKSPSAQGSLLFKGLHSVQPPGPVTFSNASSGQTQANLTGAPPVPDPGGKHRADPIPKLKPIPTPGPPPAPPIPPTGGAGGPLPPKAPSNALVHVPGMGSTDAPKAPGLGEKIGAGLGAGLKAIGGTKVLKPVAAIGGAALAGAGIDSFLHRNKNNVTKSVTWTGEIAKVDADHRQVFGWASVSEIGGKPVVDLQGDIVPIEETEKAAYRYVIESRKGGDMHRRVSKGYDEPLHTSDLIESFVVTGEKLEKMGLAPDALPHGWWVGFHVNDDAQWNLVKSGHRAGFSIHGKGVRTPVGVSKSLDDVKDKAGKKLRAVKGSLKTRTDQALHPPAVKLKPVRSSAVSEMGYQPQTRRLAYQLRSSPGRQYTYKVPVTEGVSALSAESKGSHYATKVARKAKRSDAVSPADRARLFINPDISKILPTTPELRAVRRTTRAYHRLSGGQDMRYVPTPTKAVSSPPPGATPADKSRAAPGG